MMGKSHKINDFSPLQRAEDVLYYPSQLCSRYQECGLSDRPLVSGDY